MDVLNKFKELKTFKIEEIQGYSPQIGQLVSMMEYARFTTLNEVRGLTVEQLDFLPNKGGNSIGALLLHIAAVEFGFQVELFDRRKPNTQEIEEWGAAYQLDDLGRNEIKGNPLEFYIEKLEKVRNRTLEEFKKRNDKWLYEEAVWDNNSSNNYFIWFHTFEDEINHRGQIRILKKMLPNL
ncbi:putative damage-inducible protein DinB [Virgibacillus natechei]|uniref:Damage-inducible protein DinB n=1 Tax=Virgibacillus natechei TaxID=1216297 RepID=A0ABS4IHI3_9BACI|nr:DinB family protein [Virgibacillus natechei]MBP1970405.1 putative damage-inducible protein DinB [Virgibacillus natechei]UZD13939.1 DinB family protein [Virgibacillus natechei]